MVRTERILCLLPSLVVFIVVVDARSLFPSSHEDPSRVKHFQDELDSQRGYWSPSTSSIDWCERNYVVTHYIAEFWNCLSSLSMSVIAGILFVRGLSNKLEHRFLLLSFSFGIVGLGSAYFHGTLTHWGQMADELPMVYSMIVWWYLLFHMNPLFNTSDTVVVLFALTYGLVWTYVHSLQSFVLIFQGHFTLMVIGGILRLIFLSRQSLYRTSQIFYLVMFYAGLLIPASICWLVDQHFCERLNADDARFNPQFHAWWHLICAVDCHVGIVCAEAMRFLSIKSHQHEQQRHSESLDRPFRPADHLRLHFYFGLPFVDYSSERRIDQVKDHDS